VPAAALVDKAVAINLGTDLSATRTDNLTFSELDGTVTVNGTSVSYAIGSSLSTTVYVNIPSTAKSSVSVTIGNYKLKNDFYTQFGLTASPYLEVDGKVPFWGTVKLYRKDFPPINVTLFSTAHSQLNLTTGTTTSGTIKVQSLAYVLPASPAAPPSPASFKPQDLYFAALVSAPSPAPAQTDASANVVIDLPKAAKDTSGRQALNQVLAQTDGAELLQFRFVAPGLPGIGKR
jgi:hypothetical protein